MIIYAVSGVILFAFALIGVCYVWSESRVVSFLSVWQPLLASIIGFSGICMAIYFQSIVGIDEKAKASKGKNCSIVKMVRADMYIMKMNFLSLISIMDGNFDVLNRKEDCTSFNRLLKLNTMEPLPTLGVLQSVNYDTTPEVYAILMLESQIVRDFNIYVNLWSDNVCQFDKSEIHRINTDRLQGSVVSANDGINLIDQYIESSCVN